MTMDRSRRFKIVSIFILIIAVIGLSIAYAAMSEVLSISGTAKMNSANWKIKFENLKAEKTGDATFVVPTISDTSLMNYEVNLTKPGDSVTFTFDIVNDGGINAVLGTLTKGKPECSSLTSDKDAKIVCDNLIYTLEYDNGSAVEVGDTLDSNTHMSAKLKIAYKDGAKEVPESTVNINGLDLVLIYNQD